MTRRQSITAILFTAAAARQNARAEAADDAYDVIAEIARSLAENDFSGFTQRLDRDVAAVDQFANDVRRLLAEYQFTSSIKPISNTGDDTGRRLELDWYVELKARSYDLRLVRRQALVTCGVTKVPAIGKKKARWLLTSIESAGVFAPVEANP